MLTKKKCTFVKINVLIQLFLSSTCFEHLMFIIRKTIFTCRVIWCVFYAFIQILYKDGGCAGYRADPSTCVTWTFIDRLSKKKIPQYKIS